MASGLSDLKTFLDNPGAALDVPFDADPTVQEVLLRRRWPARQADHGARRPEHPARRRLPLVYPADPNPARGQDIRIVPVCRRGAVSLLSGQTRRPVDEIRVGQEWRRPVGAPGQRHALPGEADLPDRPRPARPAAEPQGDTTAKAHAGWTLELGFGLSRDNGFFLLDNPVPGYGPGRLGRGRRSAGAPRDRRHRPVRRAGPKLHGTIGFIGMEADDEPRGQPERRQPAGTGRSRRSGQLRGPGAAVHRTGCPRHPTAPAGSLGAASCSQRSHRQFLTDASIDGAIDIDVEVRTGLGSGTIDKTLPSFATDFVLSVALRHRRPRCLARPVDRAAKTSGSTPGRALQEDLRRRVRRRRRRPRAHPGGPRLPVHADPGDQRHLRVLRPGHASR